MCGNGDVAPGIIDIHNRLVCLASRPGMLTSCGKADDAHWLGYFYIYVCVCVVRNVKINHKK